MKTPSPDRIIKDVEFEILLGVIPQENLEQAIFSIKAYQSKVHSEVLEALGDSHLCDVFNKVFVIQEMWITLLQEMIKTVCSLEAYLPEIIRYRENTKVFGLQNLLPPARTEGETARSEPFVDRDEIAKLLTFNSLKIDPEVRPVRLPFLGRLLGFVRIAFHNLVLFYVNRLGAQQAQVNRAYGEQILKLLQIVSDQQEQINALVTSIDALRSQIRTGEEG